MAVGKRVWRSGVRFDCPECGELLRDDSDHATIAEEACLECGGKLRMVAYSDSKMTGDARWFRCGECSALHMHRRGELVPTQPRTGFDEFA